MATQTRRLSDLLLLEGRVAPEDLERATEEQRRTGRPLAHVLLDLELFTDTELYQILARHLSLDYVDLSDYQIDPGAVVLVPEPLARRYELVPLGFDDEGRLLVAMSDPSNVLAIDDLRTVTDREVQPLVATPRDVREAMDRNFRMGEAVYEAFDEGVEAEEGEDLTVTGATGEDAPVVKFINALITQAVQDRASDIHFEPEEQTLRVRYRVDGVLHLVTTQRRSIHPGVVSRLKIMADLDIAERRVPQDGRISLKVAGKSIDLRVSSLPTTHGEKIVLRILDKSSALLTLTELGFLERNRVPYEASFRKPYGTVLVTGPTGSGKSTTLYATLNELNHEGVNCVTVEDPVEYRLAGINQVPINPRAGLTFPVALRSILRQDPDIVLVGEMRDRETAQIGMQAAMTGHLVLSTLHTNNAPSAVTRLTEMGIDGFLVASGVDCVLAQRLGRRLCPRCKQPAEFTTEQARAAGLPLDEEGQPPTVYQAVGCSSCTNTGYRGRLAFHEVMVVSEEIERLIVERASTDDITKQATAQGMHSLREDGLAKVAAGHTTVEEVARVVA